MRARAAVRQWKADGIIADVRSERGWRLVRDSKIPAVNVSGGRDLDMPTVMADTVAAGRMAARHFLENGFRNFAFCARTAEAYTAKQLDGFSRELSRSWAAVRCVYR